MEATTTRGKGEAVQVVELEPKKDNANATTTTTTTTATTTTTTEKTTTWGAPRTAITIPCCLCGTMIHPNAANQCGPCLAQQFDLESLMQRGPGGSSELTVYTCRQCRRWERQAGTGGDSGSSSRQYQAMDYESPQLLALCLRHIPALQGKAATTTAFASASEGGGTTAAVSVRHLRVVDASWIWTEPSSMRLRLRLVIRAQVAESVQVQQRVMVEFHVKFKQCAECNREFTNRTWHAVVQLRQRRPDHGNGDSRRGLAVLEAAISKSAAIRQHVLRIQSTRQGFDFYFLKLPHAQAFGSFLARAAPLRLKTTRKLVSTNVRNNTANLQYTLAADVVPLCRDDLVLVEKGTSDVVSLAGRLCLVHRVSSVIGLVDASPPRRRGGHVFCDLHPDKYWKSESSFKCLISSPRALVRFVVLNVELCGNGQFKDAPMADKDDKDKSDDDKNASLPLYKGPSSGVAKYALADVEVAREEDFGRVDETLQCVTHLGHLLQVGDVVLGYDLRNFVFSGGAEWHVERSLSSHFVMPDVVLVRKAKPQAQEQAHESDSKEEKPAQKKKEQRRFKRQQGKKMQELQEAATRMKLLPEEEGDQGQEQVLDIQRGEVLEQEMLRENPDLAEDLKWAEEELARIEEEEGGGGGGVGEQVVGAEEEEIAAAAEKDVGRREEEVEMTTTRQEEAEKSDQVAAK